MTDKNKRMPYLNTDNLLFALAKRHSASNGEYTVMVSSHLY